MSVGFPTTLEDRLQDLGMIPISRIRMTPSPGTATIEDVTRLRDVEGKLFELVDGTLVEKAMRWQESFLALLLGHWLHNYLERNPIGVATGTDGMTRLFGDVVRGPDVAFIAWDRLPNRKLPKEAVPDLVPNFVIEVLSLGNTYAEMSRKRREYFQAGVELAWMVDHRSRTVAVYRTPIDFTVAKEGDIIDGGKVLPGWQVDVAELFGRLDQEG